MFLHCISFVYLTFLFRKILCFGAQRDTEWKWPNCSLFSHKLIETYWSNLIRVPCSNANIILLTPNKKPFCFNFVYQFEYSIFCLLFILSVSHFTWVFLKTFYLMKWHRFSFPFVMMNLCVVENIWWASFM